MLQIRIEKLRYMVEEMQLAYHLATNITDPFYARTIARHILVRTENFIEHARRLRRPLRDDGYNTEAFNAVKEAYANEFAEYFKIARHRLGAHVQDFDFGKRIELWNDIEVVKLSYFVEGAREIYDELVSLQAPGATAYAQPSALSDPHVTEILQTLQRSLTALNGVEMGTDSLALTRQRTTGLINTHPVHARAAQLTLIGRWISMQLDLRQRLRAYPEFARLIKTRLITDVVSFCDCLVTRAVAPGAPQAMDGLDKLLSATGASPKPIDDFVAVSSYATALSAVRSVRDQTGAHLEISETVPLAALLAILDGFDLERAIVFYEGNEAAFKKQCLAVIFLRPYLADGARLHGISVEQPAASAPFIGESEPMQAPSAELLLINDENTYHRNLGLWLDGDSNQKETARHFFYKAMSDSDVVEKLNETEQSGSSKHIQHHELRKVHLFLLNILNEDLSEFDRVGVMDLLVSCRNGYPYPLAEIIVRHDQGASAYRQCLSCRALGEIASAPHQRVSDLLAHQSHSSLWEIRLEAVIAQYKSYVLKEGTLRINNKNHPKQDHDTLVSALTQGMTADKRVECLLAFASVYARPLFSTFRKTFSTEYNGLQLEIERLLVPFLKSDAPQSSVQTLKDLLQTHDYVGVCVHIALNLDGEERHPLFSTLIESCINRTISTAPNDQAARHMAMCFILKKDYQNALCCAEPIATRNPDWIEAQILVAQVLGEIVGEETATQQKVNAIRNIYTLTADQQAQIADVEVTIQNRV